MVKYNIFELLKKRKSNHNPNTHSLEERANSGYSSKIISNFRSAYNNSLGKLGHNRKNGAGEDDIKKLVERLYKEIYIHAKKELYKIQSDKLNQKEQAVAINNFKQYLGILREISEYYTKEYGVLLEQKRKLKDTSLSGLYGARYQLQPA